MTDQSAAETACLISPFFPPLMKDCVKSVEQALRGANLPYEEEVGLAAGVLVLYNLLFSMAAAAGELDIDSKEAELRYESGLGYEACFPHDYPGLQSFRNGLSPSRVV